MIVIDESALRDMYNNLVQNMGINISYQEFLSIAMIYLKSTEPDNYTNKMRECTSSHDPKICYAIGGLILGYIAAYCEHTGLCDIIIEHKSSRVHTSVEDILVSSKKAVKESTVH